MRHMDLVVKLRERTSTITTEMNALSIAMERYESHFPRTCTTFALAISVHACFLRLLQLTFLLQVW